MSVFIHIESATDACSVCLSADGDVVSHEQLDPAAGEKAAVRLPVLLQEAVSMADSHAMPIDAVSLSAGPGSYTGLRIGASLAKGLCYGRSLPLIALSTLEILCVPPLLYHEPLPDDALLCPMLDARRMEVYTALYDRALRTVKAPHALVVDAEAFRDEAARRPIYFFGPGAEKCRDVLQGDAFRFLSDVRLDARHMLPLTAKAMARQDFADVAYFEPFYLKDFVATVSRKVEKVLFPERTATPEP